MSEAEFSQLVTNSLEDIPDEFRNILNNVEIIVDYEPTQYQKRKLRLHNGMLLFGLYEGIPQTKRGSNYAMVLPDKITIFQKPIEEYYRTEAAIKDHVRITVLHEIGHHFGLSDEAMRKIGK